VQFGHSRLGSFQGGERAEPVVEHEAPRVGQYHVAAPPLEDRDPELSLECGQLLRDGTWRITERRGRSRDRAPFRHLPERMDTTDVRDHVAILHQ
jgi:hypothetical protein